MRVILNPHNNYAYSSFYVYGLQQLVGKNNISYQQDPFKSCADNAGMSFIVQDGERETKYYVHTGDSYELNEQCYAWCDVYGSVNANYTYYPKERYPKLVSLVPSFAIRTDKSALSVLAEAMIQLPKIWRAVVGRYEWNKYKQQSECDWRINIKHYFGRRYKTWKNRLPISAYNVDIPSEDSYVFFLSTLWYNDAWNKNDETVNQRRAYFIRACKSIPDLTFEGGLFGDKSSSNERFADVLAKHGEPFETWIEKTKRSALVFNTPAFWNCHGWKLGEYLALGKCIVSTKLSNDLPYPLEHGKNIHFVDDTEESMREAIEYILAHPEYRLQLEHGAKEYWEKYGTPEASLKLLGIV